MDDVKLSLPPKRKLNSIEELHFSTFYYTLAIYSFIQRCIDSNYIITTCAIHIPNDCLND